MNKFWHWTLMIVVWAIVIGSFFWTWLGFLVALVSFLAMIGICLFLFLALLCDDITDDNMICQAANLSFLWFAIVARDNKERARLKVELESFAGKKPVQKILTVFLALFACFACLGVCIAFLLWEPFVSVIIKRVYKVKMRKSSRV